MAQEKLVQESGRGIFSPFPPLNLPAGFFPSRFGSGGNLEVGRSILERGKRIGGIRRKGVDSRRSFLAFDTFPTPPSLRLTLLANPVRSSTGYCFSHGFNLLWSQILSNVFSSVCLFEI